MTDNCTKKWSEVLHFVQSKNNRALHTGIKGSSNEIMLGVPQRIGLADSLILDMYADTESKEELLASMAVHQEEENAEQIKDVTDEVIHGGNKKRKVICIVCNEEVKSSYSSYKRRAECGSF